MNTNNVDYKDPGFYALFKGPSGSGKTVAALSFPDVYMFDFDRKMPWIARKHFPGKSIEYDQFSHIEQVYDKLDGWIQQDNCPHETLLGDSFTSLATLILNSTAEAKGENIMRLVKSMVDRKGGKGRMVEPLGYDYYNNEVRFIEYVLSATKQLWARQGSNPKNVIWTAHIIESSSKPNIETKLITKTRSLMAIGNKAPAIIPTEFDEVYLFGTTAGDEPTARVKHLMTTETTGEDDAKTAFKFEQIIDFTNKDLYTILKSQIAGSEMFL
jgi:hypothetical protein